MKMYQRICLILAYHGLLGLLKLAGRRLLPSFARQKVVTEAQKQKYIKLKEDFLKKVKKMGYGDLSNYYWYHTLDLGNGLVTPGDYDYRPVLSNFKLPKNMTGMRVLDIGSATGFFSFEFEKRGANVVSVELPSIADWDMPPGKDKEETLSELASFHEVKTIEDIHHCHLDGPFEFCRKILNSNVKRLYSTIYDLNTEKLGEDAFDLIFIGDVLLHIFSPLTALAVVAPLCSKTLIISQELPPLTEDFPMMLYAGGDKRKRTDNRTWWFPNRICFEQMLKRLGFRNVKIIGYHQGIHNRLGRFYNKRAIIKAMK